MLRFGRRIVAVFLESAKPRAYQTSQVLGSIKVNIATTPTYSSVVDPNKEFEKPAAHFPIFKEVTGAQSVLEDAIAKGTFAFAFKALQVLSDWVVENRISVREVQKDENFQRLLRILENGVHKASPTVALKTLKNLFILQVSSNTSLVESLELALAKTVTRRWVIFLPSSPQSIENELLWNVRRVSISVLFSILIFQAKHRDSEMQKKVFKEAIQTIQRRWVEIERAQEFVAVYENPDFFSSDFLSHIDDRTIELAEEMDYQQLSRIFCALGTSGRRATPVLRALAFHMAKNEEELPPKQISNVLYAMKSLTFTDLVLLEKLSNDLVSQIPSVKKPAIIGSILFCIGNMQYRNTKLLEMLCEWVENNIKICRTSDLVKLLMTLASVSYTPDKADSLFSAIIPILTQASVGKESLWLDVVWALCVLGGVEDDHIRSVLDPVFVSKVANDTCFLKIGTKLKLLNVNAYAQLNMPTYSGPTLNVTDFKDVIITQNRRELILSKHVKSMLHNFFPPPKYIREDIQTTMGLFVDAELAVDKSGKPIPIQSYTNDFGEREPAKALPEGASRIALIVWDYKDYTIGSQEITGVNQIAVNLLKKLGHVVVQIPYFEYSMKEKTLKNVQYLERKIKEEINDVNR